ncbi:hypothetical protein [Luteolibacter marinus]|uniref:hypothetical protein n=1 Tax=Luteolibacter marinus TaxID=2776705 RepID=UPI0018679CE0|nr:hypothetical protein [Luteolibacter marinus]
MLANVALPSFLPHSAATAIGLLVIGLIEGFFLTRALKQPFADSYLLALRANWNSTIIGIPVAWVLWIGGLIPVSWLAARAGIEVHPLVTSSTIQSAMWGGLIPTEWTGVGHAIGSLVLLVPFCLGSIWIERRTLCRHLPEADRSAIRRAVIQGNLASYAIFLVLGLLTLDEAMKEYPAAKQRFEERQQRLRHKQP